MLALALFLALPAFAAGTETDGAPETVSFEELDALVKSGSTLQKSYDELIAAADSFDRKAPTTIWLKPSTACPTPPGHISSWAKAALRWYWSSSRNS